MSFLKSLCLAILATVFLTYVFGVTLSEWTNFQITMDGETIAPLNALGVSALITVVLVVAALAIVLSLFGGIIFMILVIFGSLLMLTLGVFWPILLMAVVIWLFNRDKNPVRNTQYNYR